MFFPIDAAAVADATTPVAITMRAKKSVRIDFL